MKLLAGEKFTACLVEMTMGPCLVCGYGGYRVLVVRSRSGNQRRIAVCAEHFAEVCARHPEIRELERLRLDPHGLDSTGIRQIIRCPCCGAQLDLAERGSYKIILATGVVCQHCHTRLVIKHNIARQETE